MKCQTCGGDIPAVRSVSTLIALWRSKRDALTEDPELLAGSYLNWTRDGGDGGGRDRTDEQVLQAAIYTVETHCSGQYIDRPLFTGCDETLALLKTLRVKPEGRAMTEHEAILAVVRGTHPGNCFASPTLSRDQKSVEAFRAALPQDWYGFRRVTTWWLLAEGYFG